MNLLFYSALLISHAYSRPLLASSFASATYDYVIVGGGTGGLTVAARLAENPGVSVAVVEAGNFYEIDNPDLQTPALDFESANGPNFNPLIDWGYFTVPQKGVSDAIVHYPRGKCLGGSSGRNYMAYTRGSAKSYDLWGDSVGDASYKWTNFLPFFQKSITFTNIDATKRAANATPGYPLGIGNTGGPLDVTFPNYAQPWSSWVQIALKAIGINPIQGMVSGSILGSSYTTNTIQPSTQLRESSETGFLKPALSKPNLIVYKNTLAKKIIFDSHKVATGVLVNTTGTQYTLSARREVIVSSGVFNSPQLLLVSGVGPAASLRSLGIPVISDLPGVGQNMWDHLFVGVSYRVNVFTASAFADPAFFAQAATDFAQTQSGPLTSPGGDFFGWEKLDSRSLSKSVLSTLSVFPSDWPHLEYLSVPVYLGPGAPTDSAQYGTIAAALVAPQSRGTVTITSGDTADPPVINPRWLTHPSDIAIIIAGLKRARASLASPLVKPVLIGDEAWPGPSVQSDADILTAIKAGMQPLSHACCTNKMGKASDKMAVVDAKGKVFGVESLRVVDVSAFALLPPGNPQSTVYALAEKIAADIKSGW